MLGGNKRETIKMEQKKVVLKNNAILITGADFVVIVVSTNYESRKNFLDIAAVTSQ